MAAPDYSVPKVDGIAVGYDEWFEDRWNTFSRWTWVGLLIFVLAGLTGVLGKGPLAKTTAGTADDPMYVQYDRYARFQTPSTLRITVMPNAVLKDNALRIFVSESLVRTLNPLKSNPHPMRTELVSGGEILEYPAQHEVKLELDLVQTFRDFGVFHGSISLPGQMSILTGQIVYP